MMAVPHPCTVADLYQQAISGHRLADNVVASSDTLRHSLTVPVTIVLGEPHAGKTSFISSLVGERHQHQEQAQDVIMMDGSMLLVDTPPCETLLNACAIHRIMVALKHHPTRLVFLFNVAHFEDDSYLRGQLALLKRTVPVLGLGSVLFLFTHADGKSLGDVLDVLYANDHSAAIKSDQGLKIYMKAIIDQVQAHGDVLLICSHDGDIVRFKQIISELPALQPDPDSSTPSGLPIDQATCRDIKRAVLNEVDAFVRAPIYTDHGVVAVAFFVDVLGLFQDVDIVAHVTTVVQHHYDTILNKLKLHHVEQASELLESLRRLQPLASHVDPSYMDSHVDCEREADNFNFDAFCGRLERQIPTS